MVQFRQVSVPDEIGLISTGIRPYIIDLDTVNGTFLNTKRLESLRQVEWATTRMKRGMNALSLKGGKDSVESLLPAGVLMGGQIAWHSAA